MKKPLMTLGVVEITECPLCWKEFYPEDGVYEINNKDVLYCSKHCLNEELLIQEEEALLRRDYEASRYVS